AAGRVRGLAACLQMVARFLLPALVLLELIRVRWDRREPGGWPARLRRRGIPLAISVGTAAVTIVLGVWVLDLLVPAYDPGTHITYAGNPFSHIGHMFSYAERLKAVPNATGISSTPWQWLVDQKPID